LSFGGDILGELFAQFVRDIGRHLRQSNVLRA
jgi:hypothetical protein